MKKTNLFGSLLTVIWGCSNSPAEPIAEPKIGATTLAASASSTTATAVPGYVHTLSASRFTIGESVFQEVNLPTMHRWRGSLGAFGLDPSNGLAMGILDKGSPRGPYMLEPATQGALVKAYFVDAGVPSDQVDAAVKTTWHVQGGGAMGVPLSSQPVQANSINSILTRSTQGISVVESYAEARMTAAGTVDWEAVFWPAVDGAVVQAAVSLQAQLVDADRYAAYVAQLPAPVVRKVGVVIHHTMPTMHGAPTAYVSFDAVIDAASTAAARHFDRNGVEFRLPQEVSAPATPRTP
jgi:hypothetical protein